MHIYSDRWMALHEPSEPWHQPTCSEPRRHAHRNCAVALGAPHELRGLSQLLQRRAYALGEVAANIGQHHAPAVAHEERRPKFSLERADLMTHSAMRDRDLIGRTREALQARCRFERSQGAQRRQFAGHVSCEYYSHGSRKYIPIPPEWCRLRFGPKVEHKSHTERTMKPIDTKRQLSALM